MDINQQREIENRATRLSVTLNMGYDVSGNKVDVSGEAFANLREERNDLRRSDVDFAEKLLAWCEKVEAALRGEIVEIAATEETVVETETPVAPLFDKPLKSQLEFARSFELAYDQVANDKDYQEYVARWMNDNPEAEETKS